MKTFVFDACSLIYLTKIKIKEKLPLLGVIIVSKTVRSELIADTDRFLEAKTLEKNLNNEIIKVSKLKIKDLFSSENLGKGERETIEICLNSKGIPVTDDHQAINYAINLGLKPKTSEVILLDLLQLNILDYVEFKTYFKELAEIKSIKPEIISVFRNKAKTILNKQKILSKGGK